MVIRRRYGSSMWFAGKNVFTISASTAVSSQESLISGGKFFSILNLLPLTDKNIEK